MYVGIERKQINAITACPMKKYFIMCLAFSLFTLAGNSANSKTEKTIVNESVVTVSVSGKVMDRITGEALAGVKVMVDKTETSSYTDFEGNFQINGLTPASYTLSLSMISYEETSLPVHLDSDNCSEEIKVNLEQITK